MCIARHALLETPSPRGDTFFYFVEFIKPLTQCPLAVHLPYIRRAYHSPLPFGEGLGVRLFLLIYKILSPHLLIFLQFGLPNGAYLLVRAAFDNHLLHIVYAHQLGEERCEKAFADF